MKCTVRLGEMRTCEVYTNWDDVTMELESQNLRKGWKFLKILS